MHALAESKSILITGGAGFLGRGLLRHLSRINSTASVTVYSRDEHKHHEMRGRYPGVRTIIGDVRDLDRLRAVVPGHDLVIHAAAIKHIPEAELDPSEAVATNVVGTQNVASACLAAGVTTAVVISTDKAVEPLNAYGATKMLAERVWQQFGRLSGSTRFIAVRYGNVAASTGSVIPVFREQFSRDGMVTITNPNMTRFWLSIDQAVFLIDHAIANGLDGETYVRLCDAAPVATIAQLVWEMHGGTGPAPNRVIGSRPAEKQHEVLLGLAESRYARRAPWDSRIVILPSAVQCSGESASDLMPYSSEQAATLSVETLRQWVEDSHRV